MGGGVQFQFPNLDFQFPKLDFQKFDFKELGISDLALPKFDVSEFLGRGGKRGGEVEGDTDAEKLALQLNVQWVGSVLQCVAVCCSVLQCVAVCCSVLQLDVQWVGSVLQCVAVCCSVMQCVAVCCS